MKTKRCPKCAETKPVSEYYKDKQRKDGISGHCKECRNAWNRSKRGRELRNKAQAKYQQTEKGKATLTKGVARYQSSEKGKATKRKTSHTRRARLKNVEVQSFTEEDLKMFWLSQNILYDECYYCGKNMDGKYEHLDHYIPISKGGGHTMVNLRPSCACCNYKKNDKMPTDFPSQR